jgi:hypothetical protein
LVSVGSFYLPRPGLLNFFTAVIDAAAL